MKSSSQKFTIAGIIIGIMACASIMAYFSLFTPKVEMPDLSQFQKTSEQPEDKPPAPQPAPQGQPPEQSGPKTPPETPSATPLPVQFTSEKADLPPPENPERIDLPPSTRLAPDMFVYSTLPFDAPMAEFPLVLVGQKSLEWYKATVVSRGGISSGGSGDGPPPIYRP
ncbi:MAG: hypothetical protein WCL49_11120, partial [bacterium]